MRRVILCTLLCVLVIAVVSAEDTQEPCESCESEESTPSEQTPQNEPSTSPILILDYPKKYQVFQRDVESKKGSILINGSIDQMSNLSVQIDTNPFELLENDVIGHFEYNIEVPQGTHSMTLRSISNDHVTEINVYPVSVGDIYLLLGQSNMVGHASTKTNVDTTLKQYGSMFQQHDRCAFYNESIVVNGTWKINNDPTGGGLHCNDLGSPWPIVMNQLIKKHDVPIAWIPGAYGGSSIRVWDNKGDPQYKRARELTDQATLGKNEIRGVLWHQGETDANWSKDRYLTSLQQLHENLKDDIEFDKFMISVVARGIDRGNGLSDGVQQAQYAYIEEHDDVVFAGETYDIEQSIDNLHYITDTEVKTFAERWTHAISKEFYDENISIPKIEHAYIYNATTMILVSNTNLEMSETVQVSDHAQEPSVVLDISDYRGNKNQKIQGLEISRTIVLDQAQNSSGNSDMFNKSNQIEIDKTQVQDNWIYITHRSSIDTSWKINYAIANTSYNKAIMRESKTHLPVLRIYDMPIKIEQLPPQITVIQPGEHYSSLNNVVNFTYAASDGMSGIKKCALIINEATYTNATELNETQNVNISLDSGQYNWHVSCEDTNGNKASSKTYRLTIEEQPAEPIQVNNTQSALNESNESSIDSNGSGGSESGSSGSGSGGSSGSGSSGSGSSGSGGSSNGNKKNTHKSNEPTQSETTTNDDNSEPVKQEFLAVEPNSIESNPQEQPQLNVTEQPDVQQEIREIPWTKYIVAKSMNLITRILMMFKSVL